MKKYEVEWSSTKWSREIRHTIEATDEDHAYRIAIEKYSYPEYSHIGVFILSEGTVKEFDNPHHKKPKNESEKVKAESRKESRPESPLTSDGSVGWFKRIERASLYQNEILLAQLAELRTIKRCVVGTVVLVIVIPTIVGVIISG